MALNRVQDRMDLYFIDVNSGKSQLMMTETTDAWIDMHPEVDFMLLDSGDDYLWTSWRDGHNHIYLYQFDKKNPLNGPAKMEAQLTHGEWEVESIDAVDAKQGRGVLLSQRRRLAAEKRICRRTEWPESSIASQSRTARTWPTSIPRTRNTTWTIIPR